MKVELHSQPNIDKWLKRSIAFLALLASMGAATATVRSCSEFVDESWTTHAEVYTIDNASMYKHLEEEAVKPYAMQSDIKSIQKEILQEQIEDAESEIEQIEDKVDLGIAEPIDIRHKTRLEKYIKKKRKDLD